MQVDAFGADFESSSKGFVDFLLLNTQGFPLVVLEAKAERKNPLVGKEQVRCRHQILFAHWAKDHIKKFDAAKPTTKDPRESERRLLLDTYRTFGCETGEPTFRYSLLDGVRYPSTSTTIAAQSLYVVIINLNCSFSCYNRSKLSYIC